MEEVNALHRSEYDEGKDDGLARNVTLRRWCLGVYSLRWGNHSLRISSYIVLGFQTEVSHDFSNLSFLLHNLFIDALFLVLISVSISSG